GGGAVTAEVDGNLTCILEEPFVRVHWLGKHRGPTFTPMMFRLEVDRETLKDSRGRAMPTVIARAVTALDYDQQKSRANDDDTAVLRAMRDNTGASMSKIAEVLNWHYGNGNPDKSRVQRALSRLERAKHVKS